MRHTIRDVARLAGVSIGTVSRVVNGDVRVLAENRRRVEQAIADLGYRPDAVAQSLVSRGGVRSVDPHPPGTPLLVTVGSVSVDQFVMMYRWPIRGARNLAQRLERCVGGPAANVAIAAAGLGGRWRGPVDLISTLGADAESDWALERLLALGVGVDGVARMPGAHLIRTVVLVEPDATRTIINEALPLKPPDVVQRLTRLIAGERPVCLHLEGFQAGLVHEAPAALWRNLQLRSFDTTGLPDHLLAPRAFCDFAGRFDLCFVSLRAARTMLGTAAGPGMPPPDTAERLWRYLRTNGLPVACTVVLQAGLSDGAVLRDPVPLCVSVPAVPPTDTTGAGDVFVGLYLAATLAGDPPETALDLALRGAVLSATELGVNTVSLRAERLTG